MNKLLIKAIEKFSEENPGCEILKVAPWEGDKSNGEWTHIVVHINYEINEEPGECNVEVSL